MFNKNGLEDIANVGVQVVDSTAFERRLQSDSKSFSEALKKYENQETIIELPKAS